MFACQTHGIHKSKVAPLACSMSNRKDNSPHSLPSLAFLRAHNSSRTQNITACSSPKNCGGNNQSKFQRLYVSMLYRSSHLLSCGALLANLSEHATFP
ncbi:hypothetical protein DUNSADRAFT_14028 [Dunaliella salina]|uniref:Encoded protein n=1 Tax=Dunaliella salina TaxID=3046 RepID=A0ABQ7H2W3_DUNSA|nr:hypothetical protein DUNSADRAFT_14028 [Dunaliella salina]|eukprot:KAF5841197.1 hypothetical protein DUNSADRAFT_14028 [Dunaliella salina]